MSINRSSKAVIIIIILMTCKIYLVKNNINFIFVCQWDKIFETRS